MVIITIALNVLPRKGPWGATKRLDDARAHLRAGEDYETLMNCQRTVEGLVTLPYAADARKWRRGAAGSDATGLIASGACSSSTPASLIPSDWLCGLHPVRLGFTQRRQSGH